MSPDKVRWQKVTELVSVRSNARTKPSPYLEVRLGARKLTFRVNYRQGGIVLRDNLDPKFRKIDDWPEASLAAEEAIAKKRFGDEPKPGPLVRTEELLEEIVALKRSESEATYEQAESLTRIHIKPFLNGKCAYVEEGAACPHQDYIDRGKCPMAEQLNSSNWLNFKTHFRLHRPDGRLFNHWKLWLQLGRMAYDKGLLRDDKGQPRPRPKFAFNEKKEDPRKRGQLIPEALFAKFLSIASEGWRDRALLQKLLIQRPGVIRKLRKDQYDRAQGWIGVDRLDSKNRTYQYAFKIPQAAIDVLERRLLTAEGPYFFPSDSDSTKPMGGTVKGWHSLWEHTKAAFLAEADELAAAGKTAEAAEKQMLAGMINPDPDDPFTPHDIRHTELTRRFKIKNTNYALLCTQADLSLEEAMETYIQFQPADYAPVAEESDQMAKVLLAAVPDHSDRLPEAVRSRLVALQVARGPTWTALAEHLGIRRQSLMRYAQGQPVMVGPITAKRLLRLNAYYAVAGGDQNPLELPPWISALAQQSGQDSGDSGDDEVDQAAPEVQPPVKTS